MGHAARRPQCGVALVIVLVLLMILTMLALAGAATATTELAMAGHEQYRQRASEAASSGIERAMARIRESPPPGAVPVVLETAWSFTTLRYVGEELALPQSSVEKLIGRHYVIDSTGHAELGAIEMQRQGALSVTVAGGVQSYGRTESGLGGTP